MGKRAKFYYSVRNCEQIAEHFINTVGPLKDQVDSNTRRIEELEKRMLTQETKGSCEAQKEITKAVSEVTKTWESKKEELKDEVKEELQTVLQSGSETHQTGNTRSGLLKAEVKVALEEEKDKAYRARSLILIGVPEPDTEDMAVGKAGGLDYVIKIFSRHMKVAPSQYRITDTTRLHGGKKNRDYTVDPRSLRVRFDSIDMVGRVAREARQLEESEDQETKKISIFRDRSKKEREEKKKLITEALEKNSDERDEAYRWIVDYEKKRVLWVVKEYRAQKPFRQRKYQ